MVKRYKMPLHHRRHDNSSVLANVGNSFNSNNDLPRNGRHKRSGAPLKARGSDDTDENGLHFGLGGLFLETGPGCQKPKRYLRAKKTKASLSTSRTISASTRQEAVSLPNRPSQGQVGLFALAHQDAGTSMTMVAAKHPSRANKFKGTGIYPKISMVNSGYDAEEDKPAGKLDRRRRRVPMYVKSHQAAAGLLSIFSTNENISRVNQSKNDDDMAWLCSRLDKQCSIADACKKRSAAPLFLVDSLCKRIDQKATPAKFEIACQISEYGMQGHHPKEVPERTEAHVDAASSPLHSRRTSSQKHFQDTNQDFQAISTRLSAVIDCSSLAGDQSGETGDQPTEYTSDKDYGCIFTNHPMEMAQVSPITLASPLHSNLQAVCPATSNSAGHMMDHTYDDGADADTEADAPKLSIKLVARERRDSTESFETKGCKISRQETNNKAPQGMMNADEIEVNSSRAESNKSHVQPIDFDQKTWSISETPGRTAGVCHETTLRRSQLHQEYSGKLPYVESIADGKDTGPNMSAGEKTLLSEPLGALRRSRRARRRTDRLSMGFGDGNRNQLRANFISNEALPGRHISVSDTRVPHDSVESSAILDMGKTNKIRRSKRTKLPTAFFHNMCDSKNALIARKRGQDQRGQRSAVKEGCHCHSSNDGKNVDGASIEDDFLADSSTVTEEEHVEVGTPATTPRQGKDSLESSGDGTLSDFVESLPPSKFCRGTRRLQGFRIAARKPPQMKKNFLPHDMAEENWTSSQLEQLHQSYSLTDPLSSTFWLDVSHRVIGKSNSECQAMWFSLAKTPILKRNKARTFLKDNIVEDDIFNATPTRHNCAKSSKFRQGIVNQDPLTSSKFRQGIVNQGPLTLVANINKLAQCSLGKSEHGEQSLPPLRQGYKKYLQDMRKDVNRAEKRKTNKQIQPKPMRHITDQDHHANMRVKLSPGGTLEIRQPEESDEGDECMYDADEEMLDSCT